MTNKKSPAVLLLGTVAILIGISVVATAGVGLYQLGMLATEESPRPADYPMASLGWRFYDGGKGPPEKPQVVYAKARRTLLSFGVAGLVLGITGFASMAIRFDRRQPTADTN